MKVRWSGVLLCLVLAGISSAQRPTSSATLTAEDFDRDGVPDLVFWFGGSGIVYRGNVDAIFPHTPKARQRKLEGSFTDAAFLHAELAVEQYPRPDLIPLENPIAVLPMRLNADAIPDLVVLRDGQGLSILLSVIQATITVNTTVDNVVSGDGACTLREAIINANSNSDSTSGDCAAGAGADAIDFDIFGGGFAVTIDIESALPFLTDPVAINGNTQGCRVPPCIDLNGIPSLSADGLRLTGGNNTVRGLAIRGFDEHGIHVESDDNFVEGNHVGTDLSGNLPFPNFMAGVFITGSSNTIGGTTLGSTGPGPRATRSPETSWVSTPPEPPRCPTTSVA